MCVLIGTTESGSWWNSWVHCSVHKMREKKAWAIILRSKLALPAASAIRSMYLPLLAIRRVLWSVTNWVHQSVSVHYSSKDTTNHASMFMVGIQVRGLQIMTSYVLIWVCVCRCVYGCIYPTQPCILGNSQIIHPLWFDNPLLCVASTVTMTGQSDNICNTYTTVAVDNHALGSRCGYRR